MTPCVLAVGRSLKALYFVDASSQSSISQYEWKFQAEREGKYSLQWCGDGMSNTNIVLRFDGENLNVNGQGEMFLSTFDRAA